MSDAPDLAAIVADVRACVGVLPQIDYRAGDLIAQRQRHMEAVARLRRHLDERYGARINDTWNGARVRIAGITSTSTSGVAAALRNWCAAAERRAGS